MGALGANLINEQNEIIHSYGKFPSYKTEIIRLIKTNIAVFVNLILAIIHFPYPHNKKTVIKKYYGK